MRKNYIAPTSQNMHVVSAQMMALSVIEDEATPAVGGGQGTDDDTSSDGLARKNNIWDQEW